MPAKPSEVKRFIRSLTLGVGEYAGRPMTLYDFQERWVELVFGLDRETGRRKRREVVLGVGRKNAKTETVAAIGLAGLTVEAEPGGLVVLGAKKRDQAALLLSAAKRFVRNSAIGGVPMSEFLQVRRDSIYYPAFDATLKTVASEAQSEHGLNPHIFVIDEGHAAMETSRELYDTLLTAQGARRDPIAITITTAGPRPSGPMFDLYKHGLRVNSGEVNDPEFGMLWYEADRELEIDNPLAWEQSNPALGKFLRRSFLAKAAHAVKIGKAPEFMFRRLHLNQWTTATERWLPFLKWQACGRPAEIPDDAEVIVALDAALSRDTFGVAVVHVASEIMWRGDEDTGLTVPEEVKVAHVRARRFVPPEGGYIDPRDVEDYVLALAARYRVVRLVYDPAYMGLLASALSDRGLPLEPYPQSKLTQATETLQRLVLDERIRHGNDPVLDEQIASVAVRMTDTGARISKSKTTLKIDAAVALAMALDAALGGDLVDEPQDFAFIPD